MEVEYYFMERFFEKLDMYLQLSEWAKIIDWIFEDKFNEKSWSSGKVGKYTKTIKRINGLSKSNYKYDSASKLNFPQKKSTKIQYLIGNGNSEARDLLRHIRNAVAHNNARIFIRNGAYFFEFKDYKSDQITQTAYILMPVENLMNMYEIYKKMVSN